MSIYPLRPIEEVVPYPLPPVEGVTTGLVNRTLQSFDQHDATALLCKVTGSGPHDAQIEDTLGQLVDLKGSGTLLLDGVATVNSPVIVPNKVELNLGNGTRGERATIQAGGSFSGVGVVQLGNEPDAQFAHGSRLVGGVIEGDGNAPTAVWSDCANEQSGVFQSVLRGWTDYGAYFDFGCQNMGIDMCEVYSSIPGGIHAVHFEQPAGSCYADRLTMGVEQQIAAGLYVKSGMVAGRILHPEKCDTGVYLDDESFCDISSVTGPFTADVDDLVFMFGNGKNIIRNLRRNAATNILVDASNSVTMADDYLGYYSQLTDPYPWPIGYRIDLDPWSDPKDVVGAWGWGADANSVLGGLWNSSGTINDEISYDAHLGRGTWELQIIHFKSTNRGIMAIELGGVSIGSIDGYAGSDQRNQTGVISSIGISTPGVKRLRIAMGSKNGSSSSYFASIQKIAVVRTA